MKARRRYFTGALVVAALVVAMVAYHQMTAGVQREPGEVTSNGR